MDSDNDLKQAGCVGAAAVVVLGLGFGFFYGVLPWLNVWTQHMEGKAELAKAEYSKKVLIQDAMAKAEAAKSLAEAEVTRAEGVAKANKIIGDSLENNEAYLHYLWIHNLEVGNNEVIYVPTETGLPIFEAGGRYSKQPKSPSGKTASPESRP